jgi:hypothetical protein
MLIKKHLEMLGYTVKDKVSDFTGVCISVSFDLYGCIQADVRPMKLIRDDGEPNKGMWMDIARLEKISNEPLMEQPNFEWGEVAGGRKGPANLPSKQ